MQETGSQERADCGSPPVRLLTVIHHNGACGGPQYRNARITKHLREQGIENLVLLPDEPGPAAEMLRQHGVDVEQRTLHRLRATLNPLVHLRFLARFIVEVAEIRRLIRQRRIDVVLICGAVNPHGAVAARLEGIPVIWQLIDTRPPAWMRSVVMIMVRNMADVVMTTGLAVARMHPGATAFGDKLVSFCSPVDTTRFRPGIGRRAEARRRLDVPEDALLVASVGHLTPQKGHEYFLRALAELLPSHPEIQARLIGGRVATQRRYAQALEHQARDSGLLSSGRFAFVDPDTGIDEYLPAFDAFVLASVPRSEGIPTTVLEAMASGVPVIASDVGSVAEAVDDGTTGRLYQPSDVGQMVASIAELASDVDKRHAMGRAAREKAVTHFDTTNCVNLHKKAIDLALGKQPAASAWGAVR